MQNSTSSSGGGSNHLYQTQTLSSHTEFSLHIHSSSFAVSDYNLSNNM